MSVFELDKDEVALKSIRYTLCLIFAAYRAFLDKKVAFHGHFYITQRHVCFYSKSFGYKMRHVIRIHDIAAISTTKEERELAIYSKKVRVN